MNIVQQMSYNAACQSAYLGQRERPHVVYEKSSGVYACMSHSMWKAFKPGRGVFLVESVPPGMRIGGMPNDGMETGV